jgi:hypothetical protein
VVFNKALLMILDKLKSVKIKLIISIILNFLFYLPLLGQANPPASAQTTVVTSETVDFKKTGLRVFKPEKCFNGYVLFNYLYKSSQYQEKHSFEPIYLVDMNGDIAYKWMPQTQPQFALLDKNGHLFYISISDTMYTTSEFRELDQQSEELWSYRCSAHHDFHVLTNNVFLISEDEIVYAPFNPGLREQLRITSPYIELVNRDKKVLWHWNGRKHLRGLERILGRRINLLHEGNRETGDWFHNNICEILKDNPIAKKDNRFNKGNIIFCSFFLDLVGIIEYPLGKIAWSWGPGILDGPHSPTMLDNGNLLIFDNGYKRGWSRVIEVNPLTGKIVWEYHATPKESFYSCTMSNALRLPNGNTFICDGVHNRLFEITHQGEVVWDFIPTFNKLDDGNGILRAEKYSKEFVESVLKLNK